MIALFDTNILLDVVANRQPFYEASAAAWTFAERKRVDAIVSAISFNNVYYIVRRTSGRDAALGAVKVIRDRFPSVPLDNSVIDDALTLDLADFEDAIQYAAALRAGANCIVTRDRDGFPSDRIPIFSPEEFASMMLAVSSRPQHRS